MSWPWEPPPPLFPVNPTNKPSITDHHYYNGHNKHTNNKNNHDDNNNRSSSSNNFDITTDRTTNNTLGDFDVLLSFLHLERTSLSAPSTAPKITTTTTTTGIHASMSAHSQSEPNSSLTPLTTTTTTTTTTTATTSQLGDLSAVMRYLQAHKTLSGVEPLLDQDTLEDSSSSTLTAHTTATIPATLATLATPNQSLGAEADNDDSLATTRRRLKKKGNRKLPIDEPSSSSSCGGCVSSESNHREVTGPEPNLAHEASSSKPPNDIDLSLQQPQQHEQQQRAQQVRLLQQPQPTAIASRKDPDTPSTSTRTLLKPNHISPPSPITASTTTTTATAVAVVKRKRPWRAARVLTEMKALFMAEQRKQHPTLDNYSTTGMTIKTNSDTLSPVIIQPIPETLKAPVEEEREEREQIMDQIPGYEPELLWRPRSHYKNFWRASTTSTTSTSTTATTDNRSSSSEEESPLHLNRGRAAAVASGSTTLTTSCMSETTSTHAAAKRLLAMRVRDSFLVPKGTSLLDQALSRAETHLPEPIVPSPPAEETVKAASTMAKLELGTMKTLAKPTTILSGPSLSPPAEKSGAEPSITEQPRIDHIPPKPISSERVFIFVDNSNILHGFYHCRQQQSEARGTAVASKDRTSIRTKPVDLQERDRASPQDKYPATLQEGTPPVMNLETMENGMALATPTTNDNGPKPFSAAMVKADGGSGGGPKAKMAKGSHLLPKFNYTKFFELLKRDRSAARQVLVGSSPLFQELDEAMEHLYETFILRRVKKFVQGELGVVPVPVKQLRYPSNYNNSNNNTAVVVEHGLYDTTETLFDKPSTSLAPVTSAAPTINTGGARGEQGVDELLHLKMLETILDHEPATMVLATGDGGDSEFGGGGFYGVIKRALDRGWHVEVVSWEDQLSGVYLELALEYGYSCEHKLAKSTGGSSGKRCHAPTEDVRVPGQQPQQKHRPLGSKKQRAKAQAQAQAQAQMQAQENKRGGHGHLRVWCLDWYGDILLQPTPSCTV